MKLVPFNEDYVNYNSTKSNWRYDVLMQFMELKRRPKIKSPELQ